MVQINGQRLIDDLRELARIGAYQTGVDRPALSTKDIEARRWLVAKLRQAGLEASMDRVGNVLGRSPNVATSILIGSHTDTVPKGGWLDGALGVGYALEIARSAIEAGEAGEPGIDVISFQDEEGTFLPFLGSLSFFDDLAAADVAVAKSKDGESLAAALETIAAEPAPLRFDSRRQVCYLEAHIEQGPRMETAGHRIGVVTGLVGIRRFRIRSHGAANHAGTTPMAMRRDAGAALIELAAALYAEFRRVAATHTVWNIGAMRFYPGADNVVPGEAEMMLELRDTDAAVMDRLEQCLMALVTAANRGSVKIDVQATVRIAPTALSERVGDTIAAAAAARGEAPVRLPSGAGHDAMVAARFLPSAMIFIPSIGGISHDIRENTSDADIIFGCEVLADAVTRLRLQI